MARPVGVTVLAILHYIGAAFAVLLGLACVFGMSIVGSIVSQQQGSHAPLAVMAGLGIVLGIAMFFGAVISALLGWGLWALKNWARIVVMILAIFGAAMQSLSLLFALFSFHPLRIIWSAFWIAIDLLIAWYLYQHNIRQAFTAAPAAAVSGA